MKKYTVYSTVICGIVAFVAAGGGLWGQRHTVLVSAQTASTTVAVGPQYDTTHVYVEPDQFDLSLAKIRNTFEKKDMWKGRNNVTGLCVRC
jgi:hypothetical protein